MDRLVRSLVVMFALSPLAAAQGPVPSPDEHLGRPLACDFQLADWKEVSSYYEKLAATSPRVKLVKAGTTTENRDFLLAVISSEQNLERLDAIKKDAARLADPRGLGCGIERDGLLERCPAILMISPAMHSTECAAPQFGMKLAWLLATSDDDPYREARERCVVLLLPCTNPDGLDHVCEWYRATVGTPYEASGLPKLYQYYTGHDDNRDWFMVTQNETRIVSRLLYSEWHPHVFWDVHQQGSRAERMFIPPFRDPLNPNLDAGVIAGIDALGSRALLDLTRERFAGIATGITFDMWWNGGNRSVPVRHGMIGLLTEAASCDLASPVFIRPSDLRAPGDLKTYAPSNRFPLPWPGGWWRLADIVEYELAFARSLLASLSREPALWTSSVLAAAEHAVERGQSEAPRAWIIPSDNRDRGAVWRLADALLMTGVEISRATSDFEADGRTWRSGALVIRRDQPAGQHVKDLFDVQRFPAGDTPYDVAGWSLPMLLGVARVEVQFALPDSLATAPIATAEDALAGLPGPGNAFDVADSINWRTAFARLAEGKGVEFDADGAPGFTFGDAPDHAVVAPHALKLGRLPRIGVYDTWSGSMDEGWLRYVLDSYGARYVTVKNEMIRAGDLAAFLDVLVLPSIGSRELEQGRATGTVFSEYVGGLDPEGSVAIETFVRGGGTLIAIDGATKFAIDLFKLKVTDSTKGDKAKDFKCPGSVLRLVPAGAHGHPPESLENSRFTAGLEPSLACFFDDSVAFDVETSDKAEPRLEVLARYAATEPLLSGFLQQPEAIAGKAAWIRCPLGQGAIHLFAFRPHFRSWTQQTFQLLFRAMLFEPPSSR